MTEKKSSNIFVFLLWPTTAPTTALPTAPAPTTAPPSSSSSSLSSDEKAECVRPAATAAAQCRCMRVGWQAPHLSLLSVSTAFIGVCPYVCASACQQQPLQQLTSARAICVPAVFLCSNQLVILA
uniref:Secreted protein n=1 Tax=Syphacia muris TaxID=451379 RepID=A0A0N5AMH4_9BILA